VKQLCTAEFGTTHILHLTIKIAATRTKPAFA
jgi:hypothetical protein